MENKQTAAEFLQTNNLTAIEVIGDLVINLVVDNNVYGLDVDTSQIVSGTFLFKTTDYTITNNILEYNNQSLDLNIIYLLG